MVKQKKRENTDPNKFQMAKAEWFLNMPQPQFFTAYPL